MEILLNLKYDWIHNRIIYDSPARLYHLTVVKTAISIWYGQVDDLEQRYEYVSNNFFEAILSLALPETVKDDIARMIELIGDQLSVFKRPLPNSVNEIRWGILKDKINWTSQGTIDKKRTVEALADATELNMESRFQIAVTFCLEDRVNELSSHMPSDYLTKHRMWLHKIEVLDGAIMGKKHFSILKTVSNFSWQNNCKAHLKKMLTVRNDLACHYFWQRTIEQQKLQTLTWEYIKKTAYCTNYTYSRSYCMLFLFTNCDKEKRIQLLRNEKCFFHLVDQLCNIEWLSVLDECFIDILKLLTADFAVMLLNSNVQRLKLTVAYRKNYVQICLMLLQFLCKKLLATSLPLFLNNSLTHSMYDLIEVGETKAIKAFLELVSIEWLKMQFSSCNICTLPYLITIFFKCGMTDFIFRSILSTAEERQKFFNLRDFDSIIVHVIELGNQIENIDKFLPLLFTGFEDVQRFKKSFVEKFDCDLCCKLLSDEKWENATNFVQWCFTREEDIICFYNKLFRSASFANLFDPFDDHISINAIVSFIRENKLEGLLSNKELVFDVCVNIFSQCSNSYYYRAVDEFRKIFDALDVFLLTGLYDDKERLPDLKKELFLSKMCPISCHFMHNSF